MFEHASLQSVGLVDKNGCRNVMQVSNCCLMSLLVLRSFEREERQGPSQVRLHRRRTVYASIVRLKKLLATKTESDAGVDVILQ